MFEVGKKYEFHVLVWDMEGYGRTVSWGTVTKVDGALIEVDGHEILNTLSPTFEGAIDKDGQAIYLAGLESQIKLMD